MLDLEITIVCIQMMLESDALELLFALKEPSDFKEALQLVDVWRSATTISGAQCVMISGVLLMLELHVYNWDYQVQVRF